MIFTLIVIGLMAAVFLIITKPGADRREKEYREHVAAYLESLISKEGYECSCGETHYG